MSTGRTTWFPRDVTWHRQELIVELGEEFGAVALSVLGVLQAGAWMAGRGGRWRSTFPDVSAASFARDEALTRSIIERAVEIGADGIRDYRPDGSEFRLIVGTIRDELTRQRRRMCRRSPYPPGIDGRIALYGGLCWMCRQAPWEHIDHVKPVARGGGHILANMRPACGPCNRGKGAKWPLSEVFG